MVANPVVKRKKEASKDASAKTKQATKNPTRSISGSKEAELRKQPRLKRAPPIPQAQPERPALPIPTPESKAISSSPILSPASKQSVAH